MKIKLRITIATKGTMKSKIQSSKDVEEMALSTTQQINRNQTITACLIVKNEEKVLARCLDCLVPFVDEIVIVDTGSTDNTKKIALHYTDRIFDFTWIDDFSAARNYSFSKATMEYIYVADADEIIDAENIEKLIELKENLLPEIELVQMYYANQLEYNTTYNYDKELRPKLYKRVREFQWKNPIHEAVTLEPVIYNSDIEIIHKPIGSHAPRDFQTFQNAIKKGTILSEKLQNMYARELFVSGTTKDFLDAEAYFLSISEHTMSLEHLKTVQCVLGRCGLIRGDVNLLFKFALKNVACEKASAEICYDLGEYFFKEEDYMEAILWYYNAAYETESELNIHYSGDYPLSRIAECYHIVGDEERSKEYMELCDQWKSYHGTK